MRTYGIEIEISDKASLITKDFLQSCSFRRTQDFTIKGDDTAEFVSKKFSEPSDFQNIEKLVFELNRVGAHGNKSSGIHFHIGAKDFEITDILNLAMTMTWADEIFWTFVPKHRRNGSNYTFLSAQHNLLLHPSLVTQVYKSKVDYSSKFLKFKGCNLQAISEHRTVEYRYFDTDLDINHLMCYHNLCDKFTSYVKQNGYVRCPYKYSGMTCKKSNDIRKDFLTRLGISDILLEDIAKDRKIKKWKLHNIQETV